MLFFKGDCFFILYFQCGHIFDRNNSHNLTPNNNAQKINGANCPTCIVTGVHI